jgi:hypothetical protein
MRMKNWILSNFNKFIAMPNLDPFSYLHWKMMSLIGSNGLEKAKDIWDTLQRAHEGTRPVKKAKRQLIEE